MQASDHMTCRDRLRPARPGIFLVAFTFLLGVGVAGAQDDVAVELGPFAGKPIVGERSEIVDFFVPPNDMDAVIYNYFNAATDIRPTNPGRSWTGLVGDLAGGRQLDMVVADFDGDGLDEVVAVWEIADGALEVVFADVEPSPGPIFDPEGALIDHLPVGTVHPNASPPVPDVDPVRFERVVKLAAGQLDRDPEMEVVLAVWTLQGEVGEIQLRVYDGSDPDFPAASTLLVVPAGWAMEFFPGFGVLDVAIGDFDADLIGEVALVSPGDLVLDSSSNLAIGIEARLFGYEPAGEDPAALVSRGGATVTTLPLGGDPVRRPDHIEAIAVDLAPRPGFGGFLGLRPDWLVVAVGTSSAQRTADPIFLWWWDEWLFSTQLAALAFDSGPELCPTDDPREFCLSGDPIEAALPQLGTPLYWTCPTTGCVPGPLPGPLVAPPSASLCVAGGQVTGGSFSDLAIFRHNELFVYSVRQGDSLEFVQQVRKERDYPGPFVTFASSCDIAVSDLDASVDDALWAPEISVAVQQLGTCPDRTLADDGDFFHPSLNPICRDGPHELRFNVDIWEPVFTGAFFTDLALQDASISELKALLVEPNPPVDPTSDLAWQLRPRATDLGNLDGDAVRLGPPVRTSRTTFQPLVVLSAPPIHFDVFGFPIDVNQCYPNGDCPFVSIYERLISSTLSFSTEFKSQWQVSVGGGLLGALGLSVKQTWGESFSKFEGNSTRIDVLNRRETVLDDFVLAAEVGYEIYEYPVIASLQGTTEGYLTAVVLLADQNEQSFLLIDDPELPYFAADHEAGNLMSYRPRDELPAAVDPSVRVGAHPTTQHPVRSSGGFDFSLFVETSGVTETREGTFTQTELGVSLTVPLFDIFDVSFSGGYEKNFETTETTAVAQSNQVDIQLSMGGVPTNDFEYRVTPVVSWDPSGAVVLDFAVDFPSLGFFEDNYGSRSDPAISLLHLWDVEKGLTTSTARRLETRDLQFLPANPQPGEEIEIVARVHNYSLMATPGIVNVKLYEGPPESGKLIASVDTDAPIPPRADAIVRGTLWTVPESADLRSLAVWVEIEPVGGFLQIHTENDRGWRGVSPLFVPEPNETVLTLAALATLFALRRLRPSPITQR